MTYLIENVATKMMQVDMEYKLTDIKELARSGDARTEAYTRDVKDLRRKLHEQIEQ
jgi:hypothetical protein